MAIESGTRGDLMTWLQRTWCGLHGHDSYLQFEQDRMFLKCVSCGHESHGWELDDARPTVRQRGDARPTVRQRGDARRHVLSTPHLVGARRVA